VANRNTDFIDWEMWYLTDTPQVSYDTWVEEGMTAGTLQGGYVGFNWFWADNRPNGTYYEHYIRPATTGNSTNVSVYYAGNSNDSVYLGGSQVGTSAGNGQGGLWANAGAEATTPAVTVNGTANNFQYRTSSGWRWAVPDVYDNSGGLWAINASGANLSANTGCGSSARAQAAQQKASPMPSDTPRLHQRLIGIGRRMATLTHDPSPVSIRMTRSTRQRAISVLSGDKVNSDPAVYVLEMKGTFSNPHHPPRHKRGHAPACHTLTVLVNAATGQLTDWGISNLSSSALSQLGAVTVLS